MRKSLKTVEETPEPETVGRQDDDVNPPPATAADPAPPRPKSKLTKLIFDLRCGRGLEWLVAFMRGGPLPLDRLSRAYVAARAYADGSERQHLEAILAHGTASGYLQAVSMPDGASWIRLIDGPALAAARSEHAVRLADIEQSVRPIWQPLGYEWLSGAKLAELVGPWSKPEGGAYYSTELIGPDGQPLYTRLSPADTSNRGFSMTFADRVQTALAFGVVEHRPARPGEAPHFRRTPDPDAAVLMAATRDFGDLWQV